MTIGHQPVACFRRGDHGTLGDRALLDPADNGSDPGRASGRQGPGRARRPSGAGASARSAMIPKDWGQYLTRILRDHRRPVPVGAGHPGKGEAQPPGQQVLPPLRVLGQPQHLPHELVQFLVSAQPDRRKRAAEPGAWRRAARRRAASNPMDPAFSGLGPYGSGFHGVGLMHGGGEDLAEDLADQLAQLVRGGQAAGSGQAPRSGQAAGGGQAVRSGQAAGAGHDGSPSRAVTASAACRTSSSRPDR